MNSARPYHHGNLREALVEAGVALAVEGGPDAVQLREAARRVGVSHNAGYRHFANRADLLSAVAEQAMSRLADAMTAALAADVEHPVQPSGLARRRLRAIGQAYIRFALAEPGLFRAAFACSPAPSADEAGPYQILNQVLDEFVTAGLMSPEQRPYTEVVAWSAVHGLSTLALDGPLRDLPTDKLASAMERLFAVVEGGV